MRPTGEKPSPRRPSELAHRTGAPLDVQSRAASAHPLRPTPVCTLAKRMARRRRRRRRAAIMRVRPGREEGPARSHAARGLGA